MIKNFKEAQKIVGFYDGGEKPKGDFYATPKEAVFPLLEKEQFGNLILEPCCGNGAIAKILVEKGFSVISRDLYDWGYGEINKDFLLEPIIDVDAVITNPPFSLSLEFTYKALECTKNKKGKVAILNRLQWLESAKRKKLFESQPLSKVWVFSKRIPRFNRFDFTGKSCSSLIAFAWFIFDWNYIGEPRIGWI